MSRSTRPRRWARPIAVAAGIVALGTACEPAPATPGTTTTTRPPTSTVPTKTTTTAAPTTTSAPAPSAPLGDEFGSGTLDPTRWAPVEGTYGNAAGGSRHCLVRDHVTVRDGTLRIASTKGATPCADGSTQPYASGFVASRGAGRYFPLEGRFAVRARVPAAHGIWPAFWLRHRTGAAAAEVDVMESFHAQVPGKATQSLHLDGQVNAANRSTWFEAPSATPGWHEFAVAIERIASDGTGPRDDVRFTFSIDGATTTTYVDVDPTWLGAADPSATWDVALNTAVDGRWVGDPDGPLGRLDQLGRCSLRGTYPDCATDGIRRVDWASPVVFEVDWVRITPR